jgi:hypothetical protein
MVVGGLSKNIPPAAGRVRPFFGPNAAYQGLSGMGNPTVLARIDFQAPAVLRKWPSLQNQRRIGSGPYLLLESRALFKNAYES